MSAFVLIPGAGGVAWYWHRVIPLLREAGHEAIAVDLPGDDESAGLLEYTRAVVNAVDDGGDVVLVAQSLAGFTAPLVTAKVPIRALVLVNAMIPSPGETPGAWWGEHRSAAGSGGRGCAGRLPDAVRPCPLQGPAWCRGRCAARRAPDCLGATIHAGELPPRRLIDITS